MTRAATVLAGIGAAQAGGRAYVRIEWGALPRGAWGLAALVLAAAAVWAVMALYRREDAARAGRMRWPCAVLRLGCLAALALVLMRPFAVRETERVIPGRLAVLVDRSASMSVRDSVLPDGVAAAWAEALGLAGPAEVADTSRHALVRRLLGREGMALLRQCARRNAVEVRTFAETAGRMLDISFAPREGEDGAPPALPEWLPDGAGTDLAGALSAVLDEQSEGTLAGILVLTDGRVTEGGDLAEAAAAAARRGVPVHFVGVGAAVAPPNVAVADLSARDHAVTGLPMRMEASVASDGYAGRTAVLVLTAGEGADGTPREVLRRSLVLAGDGARQVVDLTHVPAEGGRVRYVARVEPLPGESREQDNAAGRVVLVSDREIGVLLVAGGPSVEFRFLSAMLRRDPLFNVTTWTPELKGGTPPPASPQELLAYDVVVLCDPPLDWATADWLGSLARLVDEEGLGFAFLAGPTWTPELLGGTDESALRELLPVVPESARIRAMLSRTAPYTVPCPIEPDEGAARHPVLDVAADSPGFWAAVPPVYWMLPTGRAKPGATVMLRCREAGAARAAPLVAVQPYGLGRVFYCGTPETWRWRRRGIGRHERFWLQALRYCAAGRLNGAGAGARLLLERYAYAEGEAVRVRLRLAPDAAQSPTDEAVTLSVESGGRPVTALALRRGPAEERVYEGLFYPSGAGRYELVYVAPDGARTAESVTVGRPDAEFEDLRADYAAMLRVAAGTGGRCFGPEELGEIPEAVRSGTRRVIECSPPDALWDAPLLLAVLIGALAAEWLLRKWMGLL